MIAWWKRLNSAEFKALPVVEQVQALAWLMVPFLVLEAVIFGLIRGNWHKQVLVLVVAALFATYAVFARQLARYWKHRHEPRRETSARRSRKRPN